jgi:hypothetical protein
MNKFFILIISVFVAAQSIAQQQQSKWQEYLSFANGKKVAVAGNKVYCATGGGLFYFNTEDNSLNKITRVNGLSDFGISTIAWHEEQQLLLIAYNNSNIDLLKDNTITNLSDIKRKQITGDKNIYNITFIENEAFLSCGFGIVSVNLSRREIRETWFIGPNGSALRVNDVEVFEPFIYAATNSGLYKANFNNPNLIDYRNWERETNIPQSGRKFSHLMVHGGSLIANFTPDEYSQDAMYQFTGTAWIPYLPGIQYVTDAQVTGNYLTIASRAEFYLVNENHTIEGMANSYPFAGQTETIISPRSVKMSSDGVLWIADNNYGLVKYSNQSAEYFYPEGPTDNRVFSLYTNNGDLYVTPGGRTDSWSNIWQLPRFHQYRNREWNTFSKNNIPEMEGFFDVVEITAHPSNPDHLFLASWGGGLLEILNGELINRYTNLNSPLQSALPDEPDTEYVRIGGLDFDSEGNLWVTNSDVDNNLLKLTPGGVWDTISLTGVTNKNIGKIIITQNNDKWIQVPRGNDAYVVNHDGSQKKRLLVTSYFNNGQQEIVNRMSDVYCMAEDLEGAIWIGTSKGVAVYNSPQRIWEPGSFFAVQPSLDLKDGLYHPLLETASITAIAVDGANRKWIGTSNSGVYLVSETGEKEVLHFTVENSPLLSNNITALAIDSNSGEVFIGTSEGLISYKGDAITGKDAYANVYVYPNPVRETWDGPVTITGLVEETDVKITDISGNLVHHSTSLGGQAVWDGRNLNGNRVKTGVYLVLCTDEYGERTHIEKLLFIH